VPILQVRDQVLGWSHRAQAIVTTLTMRYIKGDFVVTGPDIERTKFKSRREAKDWCAQHYPGSPGFLGRRGQTRLGPCRANRVRNVS
jgi:hypothetical protein